MASGRSLTIGLEHINTRTPPHQQQTESKVSVVYYEPQKKKEYIIIITTKYHHTSLFLYYYYYIWLKEWVVATATLALSQSGSAPTTTSRYYKPFRP